MESKENTNQSEKDFVSDRTSANAEGCTDAYDKNSTRETGPFSSGYSPIFKICECMYRNGSIVKSYNPVVEDKDSFKIYEEFLLNIIQDNWTHLGGEKYEGQTHERYWTYIKKFITCLWKDRIMLDLTCISSESSFFKKDDVEFHRDAQEVYDDFIQNEKSTLREVLYELCGVINELSSRLYDKEIFRRFVEYIHSGILDRIIDEIVSRYFYKKYQSGDYCIIVVE